MIELPQAPVSIEPVTNACVEQAAARFELPTKILHSILKAEGGKPGEKRLNKNGTFDLGPMQINTLWLNKFSQYTNEQQIMNNGCVNVLVGAWILKSQIIQAGGDFWKGVGNYHSRTPERHKWYQWKVYNISKSLR